MHSQYQVKLCASTSYRLKLRELRGEAAGGAARWKLSMNTSGDGADETTAPSLGDWVPGSDPERRRGGNSSFRQGLPETRSQGRSATGTLAASIDT